MTSENSHRLLRGEGYGAQLPLELECGWGPDGDSATTGSTSSLTDKSWSGSAPNNGKLGTGISMVRIIGKCGRTAAFAVAAGAVATTLLAAAVERVARVVGLWSGGGASLDRCSRMLLRGRVSMVLHNNQVRRVLKKCDKTSSIPRDSN